MKEEKRIKKTFNKKYGALKYSSFIKCVFLFYFLAFIYAFMNEDSVFNVKVFVIGIIVATAVTVILHLGRRLSIGYMRMFELDMKTVYELCKIKGNKAHNLMLLANVHFFEGDFYKTIDVCDELLSCAKKKENILAARHYKILSKFFADDTEEISELIEKQRELKSTVKDSLYGYMFQEYLFIELFLQNKYDEALSIIDTFLNNEKESIYNSRKIVFLQFQKMLYEKNNDISGIEKCNSEILKCDSERKTYFSQTVISHNFNI